MAESATENHERPRLYRALRCATPPPQVNPTREVHKALFSGIRNKASGTGLFQIMSLEMAGQSRLDRAWSKSSRMSSMSSIPTERRTSSGGTPAATCCSAVS